MGVKRRYVGPRMDIQKHTYHNDIGLCILDRLAIMGPKFHTIERAYMRGQRETTIFMLIYYI